MSTTSVGVGRSRITFQGPKKPEIEDEKVVQPLRDDVGKIHPSTPFMGTQPTSSGYGQVTIQKTVQCSNKCCSYLVDLAEMRPVKCLTMGFAEVSNLTLSRMVPVSEVFGEVPLSRSSTPVEAKAPEAVVSRPEVFSEAMNTVRKEKLLRELRISLSDGQRKDEFLGLFTHEDYDPFRLVNPGGILLRWEEDLIMMGLEYKKGFDSLSDVSECSCSDEFETASEEENEERDISNPRPSQPMSSDSAQLKRDSFEPAGSRNMALEWKPEKVQSPSEEERMEAPLVQPSHLSSFQIWCAVRDCAWWTALRSYEWTCWAWFVAGIFVFPQFAVASARFRGWLMWVIVSLPMLAGFLAEQRRQIAIGRAMYVLYRASVAWGSRVYGGLKNWWQREKAETVSVFGYRVPRYAFVGVACGLALVIVMLGFSLFSKKKKKCDMEDPEHQCDECRVEEQGGIMEYATGTRTRALLHASVFVTSLVSFGNLSWFRSWSPHINFLGWIGELLPKDARVGQQGCNQSPNCIGLKGTGDMMCSECATAKAVRQLDTPRFTGPGTFKPERCYNCLCEDIVTKANIDWFLHAPVELRQAIVDDEEIRKDIEAGQVKITFDKSSGRPFIRSLRDPMTIAALSQARMFVSAGLLRTDLSTDEIRKADLVSSEMGVGFLTREEQKALLGGFDEQIDNLAPLPDGSDDDLFPRKSYWLFLKDGEWTAWRSLPVKMAGWKRDFITWKNTHSALSKCLDLVLVLTSMMIIYLVYTATFDMVSGWLSSLWAKWITKDRDVELEGRGIKSRQVARAEDRGQFKHRSYIPSGEEKPQAQKARFTKVNLNKEEYNRDQPRAQKDAEFDELDYSIPRSKVKNYIFYDMQDIEKQLELGGLVMVNDRKPPDEIPVKTRDEYDRLISAGYRVKSSSLTTTFGLEIPLAEYRNRKGEYDALLKSLHWAYIHGRSGRPTKLGMTDQMFKFYSDLKIPKSRVVSQLVSHLRQNTVDKVVPSREEVETFQSWLGKEMSSGEVLESNIQKLKSLECPNVANGHPCKIKGCPRCALVNSVRGVVAQPIQELFDIVEEALLHPEDKPILLDCVYKLMVNMGDHWVKQGTCFAGPYGFYTCRHVLYDDSGNLLVPLAEVRLETRNGTRYQLDPMTICTPRTEQLSPGQRNDFCKFRTKDTEFNKLANQTRVSLKKLGNGDRAVRILRYVVGFQDPCERLGTAERIDYTSGVCEYTCNTTSADSGAPVFDTHGHCVGIHTGHVRASKRNVFTLFYPDGMVSWFVQAEPKNL